MERGAAGSADHHEAPGRLPAPRPGRVVQPPPKDCDGINGEPAPSRKSSYPKETGKKLLNVRNPWILQTTAAADHSVPLRGREAVIGRRRRSTRSPGRFDDSSGIVVLTRAPRTMPLRASFLMRRSTVQRATVPLELLPEPACSVNALVFTVDPLDLRAEFAVSLGSLRRAGGISLAFVS